MYLDQIVVPVDYVALYISWLNYSSSVGVLECHSFAACMTRELSHFSNECLVPVSRHLCTRAEMNRLWDMAEYMGVQCARSLGVAIAGWLYSRSFR